MPDWLKRSPGTARTNGGGAPSRNRTPRSARTTKRSTDNAARMAGGNRVLVTGAAGFAGGHLIDLLSNRMPVTGWHRPGRPAGSTTTGVVWQAVDILDRDSVARAIAETRPTHI